MQKILFIVQSNTVSGAEIVLENYLQDIDIKDNLFLFTNNKIKGFYSEVFKDSNIYSRNSMVRIYFSRNPFKYLQFILNTLQNIFVIHRIVKENRITVLYGNNSIDSILLAMYKTLINKEIKTVSHLHNMFDEKGMTGFFLKINADKLNHIIVPSHATKHSLKQLIGESCPITTVYNGIDIPEKNIETNYKSLASELGYPEQKKIIAFVGAMHQRKRPDLFLSIIGELAKLRDDFIAILVGKPVDKELVASLKEKTRMYDLPVKFIGEVEYKTMHKLYEIIDYLLLTSDKDPLPTVILECMAHGKITISRDVDGAHEMIEDKENGFLFPYNESYENVSRLVNHVFDLEREEKKKICKNAINTINSKFNNQIKREKIDSIIKSLSVKD